MTYCVGLRMDRGLIFMSDTRTNAGIDNISVTRKLASWSVPGERAITLLTAGNLATTQSVVSLLDERSKAPEHRAPSILAAPTMFQVASLVGRTLREVIESHARSGQEADAAFSSTIILGGQIKGMEPRLFLIYPEGNFVEATDDSPYFQIGETKYGRPILVRTFDSAMPFDEAIKLLLVSFDSTVKSNLSVGLPIDFAVYETDSLQADPPTRIEADDAYYQQISAGWGDALRNAIDSLPDFDPDRLCADDEESRGN